MLIIYILVGQAAGVCIVLFFLQRSLNRMLIDTAIRQFDFWHRQNNITGKSLQITYHRKVATPYMVRLEKSAGQFLGASVKPVLTIDRKLWGGMIISADDKVFDCSLRNRLGQVFGWVK